MKYVKIGFKISLMIFILAAGIVAQKYLSKDPDIRISFGSTTSGELDPLHTPTGTTTPSPTPLADRESLLLPDMRIQPPEQLYIEVEDGVKKIRFDTTFNNIGKGPLELIGESDEERGTTLATQVIKKKDRSQEEIKVGEFVFHDGHGHWHVDKYAEFQLWKYDNAGLRSEMIASTDKFSFCIWDEHPNDLSLENAPETRQFPRCPENIQGNSVGWGDTYPAYLEGQELDITEVKDGQYLVRSIVNAGGSLIESDYTNNDASLFVEIEGNNITVVEGPQVKGWWLERLFLR